MRPDSILQEGTQEVGNLRLLQSQFGTGSLIDGTNPTIKPRPVRMSNLAHLVKSMDVNESFGNNVASINLIMNNPEEESDFLEAEEMGIKCPRR